MIEEKFPYKVKCIEDKISNYQLTFGKIYTVMGKHLDGNLILKESLGHWYPRRFEKIEDSEDSIKESPPLIASIPTIIAPHLFKAITARFPSYPFTTIENGETTNIYCRYIGTPMRGPDIAKAYADGWIDNQP